MGLNITNEEAHALAKKIASQTGESLTSAVVVALQERLERLERERDVAERKRRVRELLDSLPPPPPGVTSDHSDIYDAWGMPK